MRITLAALVLLAVGVMTPWTMGAQAPAGSSQSPSFEVASVKPNNSGSLGTEFGLPGGGRFSATNAVARELVRIAYSVQDYALIGLPDWTKSAHFDINARANESIVLTGDPDKPSPVFLMLRSLLADRFKLAVHRETREMAVYAMVMARPDRMLGPRLTSSTTDCAAVLSAARSRAPGAPPVPPSSGVVCGRRVGVGRFAAGAQEIDSLASMLSDRVGRFVLDRTGLVGRYDYVVDFTPDQMPEGPAGAAPPPIDSDAPSLQTALKEQLGIKLESVKAPVEVLVVDHVEPPTPD